MTEHPFTSWLRSTLEVEGKTLRDVAKSRGGAHWLSCPTCDGPIHGWGNASGDPTVTLRPCGHEVAMAVVTDPSPPRPERFALVDRDRKLLEIHARSEADECQACIGEVLSEEWWSLEDFPCRTLRLAGLFWSRLYPEGYDTSWGPE